MRAFIVAHPELWLVLGIIAFGFYLTTMAQYRRKFRDYKKRELLLGKDPNQVAQKINEHVNAEAQRERIAPIARYLALMFLGIFIFALSS